MSSKLVFMMVRIMDLKQKCSIAELKFFNDHLRKVFIIFRAENKKIQTELASQTLNFESFEVIKELFEDLGELAEDLNSQNFARYFRGLVKVISCVNENSNNESENITKYQERILKKVALIVHDYEILLSQLIQCYDGPSKFEGVMRAFEVQYFKQNRLLNSIDESCSHSNLILLKA